MMPLFAPLLEPTARKPLDSFALAAGQASIYERAADVDAEVWRAAFGDSRKDFEYYRLIEETMRTGFVYRYLLLLDEQNDPVALQPLIVVDQDLAATTGPGMTRVISWLRRLWPRFL